MQKKQVDKDHYCFSKYVTKNRWASMWHQLDEVLSLKPKSVLEIGPGPGTFKTLASTFGVMVETLDIDPELKPDHITSAKAMPFQNDSYDVVCAFQMLEHVPYDSALTIFAEMCRISRKSIVISLPDARPLWACSFYIHKKTRANFFIPRPWKGPKEHFFDGEHYWEINKKGYQVTKVKNDFVRVGGVLLERIYRVTELPYHHFLVFKKTNLLK